MLVHGCKPVAGRGDDAGFCARLGLSHAAGMLAAIVYQLCGFVLASVVFQMMIGGFVWLPLMLWMIEWIIHRPARTRQAVIVGAAAWA